MAITTFLNTVEVKNVSPQLVTINIKPMPGSDIFDSNGGNIRLVPTASVEAEDTRFDLKQLQNLENNRLIKRTRLTRRVTREDSAGTGST